MNEKAESLLQTPISKTPFPTSAAYSRDKLQFAHNFIDAILKWQRKCAEELEQLFEREIQSISNDEQLPQKWEKLLTKFMLNLKKEILGVEE